MAAAIWLVRANQHPNNLIDGIDSMIINNDDLDTEATTLTQAHAKAIAMGHALPAEGYFTTAALALGVGEMDADQDAVIFQAREEGIA